MRIYLFPRVETRVVALPRRAAARRAFFTGQRDGVRMVGKSVRWQAVWLAVLAASAVGLAGCASPDTLAAYDDVIADLEENWRHWDAACDPAAVFAMAYLMLNRAVRDELDAGRFHDADRTARWATTFGQLYLDAAAARRAGQPAAAVWQAAFDWGDSNRSTAVEDLLVAMAAHIGHDLPVATWSAGLPAAGREDDFLRVNEVFRAQVHPITLAVADEYSPILDPPVANNVTERIVLSVITRWRDAAWDDAVALDAAPDDAARDVLRTGLVDDALAAGRLFHVPKTQTAPDRTSYCHDQNAAA